MLLAEAEAKFTDGIVAVNDFLFDALDERLGRTKQPIKGKRRNPRYKEKVLSGGGTAVTGNGVASFNACCVIVVVTIGIGVLPSPAMVSPASIHPVSSSLSVSDFSESFVSCRSSLGEIEPEVFESRRSSGRATIGSVWSNDGEVSVASLRSLRGEFIDALKVGSLVDLNREVKWFGTQAPETQES